MLPNLTNSQEPELELLEKKYQEPEPKRELEPLEKK